MLALRCLNRQWDLSGGLNTVLHHDMHHRFPSRHFSLYFTHWDRWCGSEHPDYARKVRSRVLSPLRQHDAFEGGTRHPGLFLMSLVPCLMLPMMHPPRLHQAWRLEGCWICHLFGRQSDKTETPHCVL